MKLFLISIFLVGLIDDLFVKGDDEPSCPEPSAISPCNCTLDGDNLSLDCSDVTSEEELETALQADFPWKDFYLFGIYDNFNVTTIESGIFGDLTFRVIEIKVGYVEEVEAGAFNSSALTLEQINLFNNELKSFPFGDLEDFQNLWDLELTYNHLDSFPADLKSESLQTLDLSKNPLGSIPANGLQGLPSLSEAIFESCEVSEVYSGTFTGLPNLNYVTLFSNNITHIPTNFMELHGEDAYAYLGINSIDTIETGAFKGISRIFDMDHNELTTVDEDIWRPMLEVGAGLYLIGNPLECGCDLKWLIQDAQFVKQLDPYAVCANGTLLADLDPSGFEDC